MLALKHPPIAQRDLKSVVEVHPMAGTPGTRLIVACWEWRFISKIKTDCEPCRKASTTHYIQDTACGLRKLADSPPSRSQSHCFRTVGRGDESSRPVKQRPSKILLMPRKSQHSSLAPLYDWRTCRRTCSSAYCCGARRRQPRFYRWSKLPICRGPSRWGGCLWGRTSRVLEFVR